MTNHDLEIAINGLSESDAIRFADWCDAQSEKATRKPVDEFDGKHRTPHDRAHRAADRMTYRFGILAERLLSDRMPRASSFTIAIVGERERANARSLQAGWLLEHTARQETNS